MMDREIAGLAHWIIVGDADVLERSGSVNQLVAGNGLPVQVLDLQQGDLSQFSPGKLSAAAGQASIAYIRAAVELCLQGKADAMVTAPVNKEAVSLSEPSFTGHTEFITQLCGAAKSRMMLVNDQLSVIHVSTHVALRKACELSVQRVRETIELGHQALQDMGTPSPRIAVCGLNPHAGEHGLFGSEDAECILPAVQSAKAAGIGCEGPFPADTIILMAVRGAYDLVVVMFHDQGHVPMKLLDFERTVNVTVGLPIIRTSVDHGTAFDIAGKDLADPNSMKAAMALAVRMASSRRARTRLQSVEE